jgi:hypothetical protein
LPPPWRKCVVDQVAQQGLQQQRVSANLCVAVAQDEIAVALDGFAGRHGQDFLGDRAQRHGLHRVRGAGIESRQREQLRHEVGGAVAAGENLGQRPLAFGRIHRRQRHLGLCPQRGQRGTKFVRGVGRESAARFPAHDRLRQIAR